MKTVPFGVYRGKEIDRLSEGGLSDLARANEGRIQAFRAIFEIRTFDASLLSLF